MMITRVSLHCLCRYHGLATNKSTEICEDVQDECQKFGKVEALKVPRPSGGSRQSAGVGKIFVKFDTKESAKKALNALAGRKFADRTVVTTYFPEVRPIPTDPVLTIHSLTVVSRKTLKLVLGKRRGEQRTDARRGILLDFVYDCHADTAATW